MDGGGWRLGVAESEKGSREFQIWKRVVDI